MIACNSGIRVLYKYYSTHTLSCSSMHFYVSSGLFYKRHDISSTGTSTATEPKASLPVIPNMISTVAKGSNAAMLPIMFLKCRRY